MTVRFFRAASSISSSAWAVVEVNGFSTKTCLPARNAASARVLEHLGMRREAHHLASAWWKGEWTDEYVYALLAEEWAASDNG